MSCMRNNRVRSPARVWSQRARARWLLQRLEFDVLEGDFEAFGLKAYVATAKADACERVDDFAVDRQRDGVAFTDDEEVIPLTGGLGGTLQTGRTLDYVKAGNDNRRICSLYLSIMDRMGIKLDRFGDAESRLANL